jgi:hypothetical protein
MIFLSSVIINNFNIRRSRLVRRPTKADAPLVVDPDGILPSAVALQGFQTVGVESSEIPE